MKMKFGGEDFAWVTWGKRLARQKRGRCNRQKEKDFRQKNFRKKTKRGEGVMLEWSGSWLLLQRQRYLAHVHHRLSRNFERAQRQQAAAFFQVHCAEV